MSLAETQQIYELLVKINEILSDIGVKTEKVKEELPKTKEAVMTARQALRLLLRLSHLLAHVGFPPNMQQAISQLTRFIFLCRMAYISLTLLSSGTPYGLIAGAVGLTLGSISMGSMLEGY